jgi:hypothetical protein
MKLMKEDYGEYLSQILCQELFQMNINLSI